MTKAKVLSEGTLHCFPAGLEDDRGRPVNAEVSAAVFDGRRLILASDKPIPGEGRSSVFAVGIEADRIDASQLEYYTADFFVNARKYEDFALTPDGDHILATTGFDRIDLASHDLNAYNQLLIWPLGKPDAVQIVDPDPRDGVEGSLELRTKLSAAIGTPYYKIEGLAAIPGGQGDGLLLFGVREAGDAHDDFVYLSAVVGAHYRLTADGNLEFIEELRELYSFDPDAHPAVKHACGLSSLEYDPYHNRLFLLTSFETEEAIGGYLWVLTLEDFVAGVPPEMVTLESGEPLEFEHKAEGLAVLDEERMFVAYDNDRHLGLGRASERHEREACEAPYTILRISH